MELNYESDDYADVPEIRDSDLDDYNAYDNY